MFDSYSCLAIDIAHSNFTFCGTYTLSFVAHHIIAAKRAQHLDCYVYLQSSKVPGFCAILFQTAKKENFCFRGNLEQLC